MNNCALEGHRFDYCNCKYQLLESRLAVALSLIERIGKDLLKGDDELKTYKELKKQIARRDAEIRSLNSQLEHQEPCEWEADNARLQLGGTGLAEEFPYGCDTVGHIGEALIHCRTQRDLYKRALELAVTDLGLTDNLRQDIFTVSGWLKKAKSEVK